MDKFTNYKHLQNYLHCVARDNKKHININDFTGLENIYNYLLFHRSDIKYNFEFSDWSKLIRDNNIEELKRVSDYGANLDKTIFSKDIVDNFGLKVYVKTSTTKDMLLVYQKPIMSSNIGCYFIFDGNDELVYIGKSTSNLLARSCQSSIERLYGDFGKIELHEYNTKAEANIFEIYYISNLKPKFNTQANVNDNLPFKIPDTSISHKIILPVYKKEFESSDCEEYMELKEKAIIDGHIVLEKKKGSCFRPCVPL